MGNIGLQGKTESDSQVYDILFQEDDITWQSMIYELAREGKINPWDIDLSQLSKEYIEMLKKFKEMNFRLSGKVVLAAAILLKMKTDRLGVEHLLSLTEQIESGQYGEEYSSEDVLVDDGYESVDKRFTKAGLQPRIPGLRKRKVTVFELVEALKRAIDVDEKRQARIRDYTVNLPDKIINVKKIDIFAKIKEVYGRLISFINRFGKKQVEFSEIVPSKEKRDKIWTFVPLLHLANQGKVKLTQEEHFGKIRVEVLDDSGEIEKEKED